MAYYQHRIILLHSFLFSLFYLFIYFYFILFNLFYFFHSCYYYISYQQHRNILFHSFLFYFIYFTFSFFTVIIIIIDSILGWFNYPLIFQGWVNIFQKFTLGGFEPTTSDLKSDALPTALSLAHVLTLVYYTVIIRVRSLLTSSECEKLPNRSSKQFSVSKIKFRKNFLKFFS